jgi:site-specific recombinase XerD
MRNRALIATLYRTGIKTGEAIALDATDVSFGDATLAVRGRDGRERILGVDPDALSLLGHWADARTKLGLSGGPLFSTLEGRPLAGSYIRTFLARLGKEVGLDKRVHPAGLRSTHAAELVDEGAPLTLIQAQLGLSSLSATERYLKDLNLPPVNRVKYLQDRHWRAKP